MYKQDSHYKHHSVFSCSPKPPPWNFQWSNTTEQLKCQQTQMWCTTLPCPHSSTPSAGRKTGGLLLEVFIETLYQTWKVGGTWQRDFLSHVSLKHPAEIFGTCRTPMQRLVYFTPNKSAHPIQTIRDRVWLLILDHFYHNKLISVQNIPCIRILEPIKSN